MSGGAKLPYKRRLAYARSDGYAYINLGFIEENLKDIVVYDIVFTSNTYNTGRHGREPAPRFSIRIWSNVSGKSYRAINVNDTYIDLGRTPIGIDVHEEIDMENGEIRITANGLTHTVNSDFSGSVTNAYKSILFGHSAYGAGKFTPTPNATHKLKSYMRFSNGVLENHIFPVEDNNGVICVYDKAKDVLMYPVNGELIEA